MTRIAVNPANLLRTATVVKEVGLSYLSIVRELEALIENFPQMDVRYTTRIRPQLETALEDLARLVLFHDPDVAAMRMAAEIIERDQDRAWGQSLRGPVEILDAAYKVVEDVYDTAQRYGMSLPEALDHMNADKVTHELVRVLGEEGTLVPGKMGWLTGAAGVGLDFLEEYTRSDGSLWEATQRTMLSSGGAMALGATAARACARWFKIPVVTGGCMLIGGIWGEKIGEEAARGLFDRGELTPEERQRRRAAASPSGLTPAEERRRLEDARAGFEQARREMVEELLAAGEDVDEAERIAELTFPEYLVELSY